MPIGLGDGVGLQHVLFFELGARASRDVDSAIDVDPSDVDPARAETARQRLRKPRNANFAEPNAAESGPAFMPAVAPVNSIAPCPFAIIASTTCLTQRKPPNALARQELSNCSSVSSITVPRVPPPAL